MTDPAQPHPHLSVARDGAVLTVTLTNAARRNAQTPSLWLALADLATTLDPDVRVVVLRGEGQSFSAGLDRAMLAPGGVPGETDMVAMAAGSAEEAADTIEGFQRGFSAWAEVPAVVVAAVQGHAIGAGFQLALAADLRVVAEDVQLAMRETSLGLVPDLGGTGPLVSLVGLSRALEICATGRFVGAAEAVAIGLANVAVPLEALEATTADLVAALLAAPDGALRELKPLLRSAVGSDRDAQLRRERAAQGRLLHGIATKAG
ncbi:Enoyl-CoA hydratase/carnithine racemase [Pedococcus dokdonensis]|uniref:Enoyl-CoA hydratase/carnithine racemase n=1 Tax=Pedococcus dokdonensis TaxID=443156 RepID=A0A1H0P219_9MICO|nr:enoyl-CoA hydratase/isomerase family protein [Pedococcus dokdonensis]SDO99011.1 Enoyl-CoA hydratase/carnithine racemase [Pedococcus dokdonensis]